MARLVMWTPEEAKKELNKRLAFAREARQRFEREWEENERTLYNTNGVSNASNFNITFETLGETAIEDVDQSSTDYGINYAFKNYRFIHSQLSANPPTVVTRPTSNDPSDRRKSDAADRLIRYAIRQYKMQELFDLDTAKALKSGISYIKTVWNPDKGDILEMNPETGDLLLEGDIDFSCPSYWNVFLDPDAECWDDVKWIFERIVMPYEEACFRFPEKKELLEKNRQKDSQVVAGTLDGHSAMETRKYDVVEIFEYWEKGLPYNGMLGRFCYMTKEGDLLSAVTPSPFRFAPPTDRGVDMPEEQAERRNDLMAVARLPYHHLTDLDVTESPYGRSAVAYEAPLQDLYNRMINVVVDNLQAHAVARIILPEGTEIADGSITNSPLDIIKTTGQRDPKFMEPMKLPAELTQMLQFVKTGIDDMAGVNESMFGQQSREQSGFSMQYATNQGNLIRRRLFNKYVLQVESVYKAYLDLIRKHWTETRVIYVLGKEKSFEAVEIKGTDINGGFDIVVEYGASLSLDPTSRREEILTLMPLFKEAGIDTTTVLGMLKLNELESLYDINSLADDRQREIFEEMVATGQYIPPRELQQHQKMLTFAYNYVMTTEYKYLSPENQALIDRHIKEREMLAAQGAQPSGMPGQPGPAAGPGGPLPPVPGGGQADGMAPAALGPTAPPAMAPPAGQ